MNNQNESSGRIHRQAHLWRWFLPILKPLSILGIGALLIFGLGLAQRLGWISAGGDVGSPPSATATTSSRYICPMMCTPPQSEPGRCPVCYMELVPVAAGAGQRDPLSVTIDPVARRVAGITTVAVKAEPITQRIDGIGEIRIDEGKLATISAYVDGRLDHLYADYTGVVVEKGDHLALVYSPELYTGQVALLQAKRALSAQTNNSLSRVAQSQQRLHDGARQKLLELGMTEQQVQQIETSGTPSSRMHLSAPISGTVIEKYAVEGQYITAGEAIYRLADLSKVWLMVELFPEDAARVHYGQRVQAEVQSLPGQSFDGRVAFLDPMVDPTTRTVGVRVVMENDQGLLRIGDYAKARIEVELASNGQRESQTYDPELAGKWISPRHPHVIESTSGVCRECGVDLVPAEQFGFAAEPIQQERFRVVPRDAVLMAGGNSVVYVETNPGRFEIRPVVLGPVIHDRAVILEGVSEGEHVAVNGNFLIDSQMQLTGNPSLIDPTKALATSDRDAAESTEQLAALAKLSPEDQELAKKQRICPVTKQPLGSMGPPPKVDVGGRPVFVCCQGCAQPLLDDPEKYLANLDPMKHEESRLRDDDTQQDLPQMQLPPTEHPERVPPAASNSEGAKIAAALAELASDDRVLAERQKNCPVTDEPLGSMGTPIKVVVEGRSVFICCEGCRESLLAEPEKYLATLPKEVTRDR